MLTGDIVVEKEVTAANTDVLASTELDSVPGPGTIYLFAGSTVNTATLEAPQYKHQPGRTALIRKRTDGIPDCASDPCFVIPVSSNSRPVIAIGGTTGTVHITAIFVQRR